jgi:hypothetical protein
MKETNYLISSQHLPFIHLCHSDLFPSQNWTEGHRTCVRPKLNVIGHFVRRPCKRYFKACIFRGIIATERCCFPQLLKFVHSVSNLPLWKANRCGVNATKVHFNGWFVCLPRLYRQTKYKTHYPTSSRPTIPPWYKSTWGQLFKAGLAWPWVNLKFKANFPITCL